MKAQVSVPVQKQSGTSLEVSVNMLSDWSVVVFGYLQILQFPNWPDVVI